MVSPARAFPCLLGTVSLFLLGFMLPATTTNIYRFELTLDDDGEKKEIKGALLRPQNSRETTTTTTTDLDLKKKFDKEAVDSEATTKERVSHKARTTAEAPEETRVPPSPTDHSNARPESNHRSAGAKAALSSRKEQEGDRGEVPAAATQRRSSSSNKTSTHHQKNEKESASDDSDDEKKKTQAGSDHHRHEEKDESSKASDTVPELKKRHYDDEGSRASSSSSSTQATHSQSTVKVPAATTATSSTSFKKKKVKLPPLTPMERQKRHFPPESAIFHPDKNLMGINYGTLVTDEDQLIGDVRFLLDFAILGHAKCATTYMMKWLHEHPQAKIWNYEVCDIYDGNPASLARKLYADFPPVDSPEAPAHTLQRGFKCPGHFSRRSLRYFRRYYAKTKLIVGLRHPVRWFESYYNFRNRHQRTGFELPDADELVGECTPEAQGVCTDNAQFHANLAIFGKTNMTSPSEQQLLRLKDKYSFISPIDNPVFVYDVAQLYDKDPGRRHQFKTDVEDFLNLHSPLITDFEDESAQHPKEKRIDICKPKYEALRQELLRVGNRASQWIRKYFIKSSTVVVSNPDHFSAILKEWSLDPCIAAVKQKS